MTAHSCPRCSSTAIGEADVCPDCGHVLGRAIHGESARFLADTFAPSVIIDGLDADTGDSRIRVNDPDITSEARRSLDGRVSMSVSGVPNVGRAGEPRLSKTLVQTLRANGIDAAITPGIDRDGEDGILAVGDETLVLQAVTAPMDDRFWRKAKAGAEREANVDEALDWVRSAIEMKAGKMTSEQRAKTVLAVDVRHAGFLTEKGIIELYLQRHGDPQLIAGFASVWVVGPTIRHCARVGSGTP